AKGGRLYDKWWKEQGAAEPTGDHALWATQDTNVRSGPATWRCKECHGWDYKGKGGAYSSGSHFTGFPGVLGAASTTSRDDLVAIMKGSKDFRHDFTATLGDDNIGHLVDFMKNGLINDTLFIDYATAKPISADLGSGKSLFETTCALCHGTDGKQIVIDGMGIGEISRDEPAVEILHKIRVGQPGTAMPSAVVNGWSSKDAADVLGYIMTLP
ncbi:MAG: cytochrome c, partial [Dehalococcoidia bacterium]